MLKTNSKQVKAKVRGYILANFIYEDQPHETESETLDLVARCFIEAEYSSGYQRSQNLQEAFIWWLQGLPCGLGDWYLCRAVDLVGDWLEQTTEERNQYSEQQAERLASYLVFKEVSPYIYKNL
jgi:hypothetical protein